MTRQKHAEPLGPANDRPLEVTQELVALYVTEEPGSMDPLMPVFEEGVRAYRTGIGEPPLDPELLAIWQSGVFAAELQLLGGQA